jgi:hypothetical protein
VNRMAVSHWIEHQTPVGASRNSCTPHAACRTVQVRAGQQVLTAADPTDELHRPSTRSNHPTVCTDTKIEVTPSW